MLYRLYVLLMVAFFLLGPLPSRAEHKYTYKGQGYSLDLHDFADKQIIVYQGEIMPLDGTKPLKQMLRMLTPGKNIELALGISGGGERDAYIYFGESLRKICPKGDCKITTYVHRYCASACVWLFMYGDERLSNYGAHFGFHRAFVGVLGIHLIVQSKKDWKERFVRFGADPNWIAENGDALLAHQKRAVFARPEQMVRAGIVHKIDWTYMERTMTTWPDGFDAYGNIPAKSVLLEEVYSRP